MIHDLDIGYNKASDIQPIYPQEVRKNGPVDKLWVLWKMYIDYFVVGNTELKKIMFHSFMGVILTYKGWRYIVSGDTYCSTRVHLFIIQPSGTGKSQMMKAWSNLLMFLNVPTRYTSNDNESNLVGSSFENRTTGDMEMVPGTLSTLFALGWDEGEILLSGKNAHMNVGVLTAQLQNVMDEPGQVAGKGMRAGNLSYPSNTTLVAGSYMFDEFKQTLLQKGFLQRMFMFYKYFTKQESDRISAGIELMKLQQNPDKIIKLREKIKEQIAKIPECDDRTKYMKFEKSAVIKWIPIKMRLKKKYINGAYNGEKQDTLETFFNRFHNLIDKIACQHAILQGKNKIGFEDIMYAKKQALPHLQNVLECFDSIQSRNKATPEQRRILIVIKLVNLSTGISQSDLMIKLGLLKNKSQWDLGSNRTFELLKKLSGVNGALSIVRGDKNQKFLYVNKAYTDF